MKQIVVGKICKPQGVKGEVKVQCYVDAPDGFLHIHEVYLGDKLCRIERCRVVGGDVFLMLEGVGDRNAAELLRNVEISVSRQNADSLKKGDYFISDLVGLRVMCEGQSLGVIVDVLQYGAADVFVIEGQRHYMAPYLKSLVQKVDLQAGTLMVDKAKWEEVSCEN